MTPIEERARSFVAQYDDEFRGERFRDLAPIDVQVALRIIEGLLEQIDRRDKMEEVDWQTVFKNLEGHGITFRFFECGEWITAETLYQAFKARFIAEMTGIADED